MSLRNTGTRKHFRENGLDLDLSSLGTTPHLPPASPIGSRLPTSCSVGLPGFCVLHRPVDIGLANFSLHFFQDDSQPRLSIASVSRLQPGHGRLQGPPSTGL